MGNSQFIGGERRYSLAALIEKITLEFALETTTRPDILLDSADDNERRELIRAVTDYVLATESISLSQQDRVVLNNMVYNDIFGFGPLHSLLEDASVTEIIVDGPGQIYVRRDAADPVQADVQFDDSGTMERTVNYVLSKAKAQLSEADPILEVGLMMAQRPIRIATAMPPISAGLQINVRLHPAQPETLDSLIERGVLDESAARLLRETLAAGRGLMIAGEPGSGKTTLLEALLPTLDGEGIAVERAIELRLPANFTRLAAIPAIRNQPGITFADQILAATSKTHAWLVVDEIRFDEAPAMWDALTGDHQARCLWVFRGSNNPLRLKSAFSMSVRRAKPGIEQELIYSALLARLPRVALLARRDQKLRLTLIGEWQKDGSDVKLVPMWPIESK